MLMVFITFDSFQHWLDVTKSIKKQVKSKFTKPLASAIHTYSPYDVFAHTVTQWIMFWACFALFFQLAHHTAFIWESNSTPQSQTTCTRSSPGQLRHTLRVFQLMRIGSFVNRDFLSQMCTVICLCTMKLKNSNDCFVFFFFPDICLSYSWSKTSSVESEYLLYHNCCLSHAQILFFFVFSLIQELTWSFIYFKVLKNVKYNR